MIQRCCRRRLATLSLVLLCLTGEATAVLRGIDTAPADADKGKVNVSHQKQLLVDDYVIASMQHVKRRLGQVTKLNGGKPILVRDREWEQSCSFYGTTLHDGKRFRMWYRMGGEHGPLGYAESQDGVRWTKPDLGLVKFKGSTKNNIVDTRLGLAYAFSCFIDPHETDPAHKYKCCWGHPRKIRACIGYSADGLRWTPYNNGEPITHRAADTHSQLLWDSNEKTYRLFTRTDYQQQLRAKIEVRGHRVMTNPDVKANPTHWKLGRTWYFDRTPKEYRRRQVYSMTDWIYQGIHFGIVSVYEYPHDMSEGPLDLHKRHERDVLNFYIATSRDAIHWDFQWVYAGQPLVPRGNDGQFDKDMLIPGSNFITHNDRHWIYYGGHNERHGASKRDSAIGGATLRLDGIISLHADDMTGVVTTKPFALPGKQLLINAKCRELRVEVLDANGKALPGFALNDAHLYRQIDELRLIPRWKKNLAKLEGRTVRLRFHFAKGDLYSFHFPAAK